MLALNVLVHSTQSHKLCLKRQPCVEPGLVKEVWELIKSEASERGLVLQAEKSALGWYHEERPLEEELLQWARNKGINIITGGWTILLGAPVGVNEVNMSEWLLQRVKNKDEVYKILQDPTCLTAVEALELQRVCLVPSLS